MTPAQVEGTVSLHGFCLECKVKLLVSVCGFDTRRLALVLCPWYQCWDKDSHSHELRKKTGKQRAQCGLIHLNPGSGSVA